MKSQVGCQPSCFKIGKIAAFKDARIQLKTDQEPAIVSLQIAIQVIGPKAIIPVNSPVGESESNGRVENAIRRVQ